MDEFRLIARLRTLLEAGEGADDRVMVGNGDDAAVLQPRSGQVVATTDALVEGVHFRLDLCTPQDVGFRAVAVNLSDLAAMGSPPLALLASLCIPAGTRPAVLCGIARGVARACRTWGTRVVGGNITKTEGPLVLGITALGEGRPGGCFRRGDARPGDAILVSGPVGSASLGLALLRDHPGRARAFPSLARAYRRPVPRLDAAADLSRAVGRAAVIDVSDGLLADLGHVLGASSAGAVLDVDRLPIPGAARRFAALAQLDAHVAALTGGDDYELLACVDPAVAVDLEARGFTRIGRVTGARGRIDLIRDGRRWRLPGRRGWTHGID